MTTTRLACAVWGDWHIDQFVRFCWPSMNAAGNLEALTPKLRIHTRRCDAERLQASLSDCEIIGSLSDDLDGDLGNAVQAHTSAWMYECDKAARLGESVILISPDVIYGEGTFARYVELLGNGADAVHHVMHRVNAEDAGKQMLADYADGRVVSPFARRYLARIALDHEHLLSKCYRFGSQNIPRHVEFLNWECVKREAIMTRIVVNDCRALKPANCTLKATTFIVSNDVKHASIRSSDEAIGLSLTPAGKDKSWVQKGGPLDYRLAVKALRSYGTIYNREMSDVSYRLFATPQPDSVWEAADFEADGVIREIFRQWELVNA